MDESKYGAFDGNLEMTDSEGSTDSSETAIFEVQQPHVFEVHDIVKNKPGLEGVQTSKRKKNKKKRKRLAITKDSSDETSSTASKSSVPPIGINDNNKEEFYDAHESGLDIIDNPDPVKTVPISQAFSEHESEPKILNFEQNILEHDASSLRELSTITHPKNEKTPSEDTTLNEDDGPRNCDHIWAEFTSHFTKSDPKRPIA